MTDQSRVVSCCRAWERFDVDRRTAWEWQVLHRFGHSRVPFSVGYLASTARVDRDRARSLVIESLALRWLQYTDTPDLFVGRLTAKR